MKVILIIFLRNSATKVRTAKVELAEKVCDTVGKYSKLFYLNAFNS